MRNKKPKPKSKSTLQQLKMEVDNALTRTSLTQEALNDFKERFLALPVTTKKQKENLKNAVYAALLRLAEKNHLSLEIPTSIAVLRTPPVEFQARPATEDKREATQKDVFYTIPKNVQDTLFEGGIVIENAKQALLKYAPGSDAERLTRICTSLQACCEAAKSSKPVAFRHLLKLKKNANALASELHALSFEGKGGLKDEKGAYVFYCKIATPLVAFMRGMLGLITSVVNYLLKTKEQDNVVARAILKRPYFFQAPLSKEEQKIINTQIKTLNLLADEALNALNQTEPFSPENRPK